MSIKKWSLLLATGLVSGAAIAAVFSFADPRSSEAGLQKYEFASSGDRLLHYGKSHQAISVQLRRTSDLNATNNQDVTFDVAVTSKNLSLSRVTLEWVLPPGVSILEGHGETRTVSLTPGEAWKQSIRVRGLTMAQNQVLRLDARGIANGQPVASQGVFATQELKPNLIREIESDGGKFKFQQKNRRLPAGIHF